MPKPKRVLNISLNCNNRTKFSSYKRTINLEEGFMLLLKQSKMNKLLICGMVLLSTTATPQNENPLFEDICQEVVLGIDPAVINVPHEFIRLLSEECAEEVQWNDIAFLEEEETDILDFEATAYLPDNFDPYAAPTELAGINYIEEESGLDPYVDTANYLPEGFNAYDVYVNWVTVVYIEEEDLDLGFDTAKYLPVGFDPYASVVVK